MLRITDSRLEALIAGDLLKGVSPERCVDIYAFRGVSRKRVVQCIQSLEADERMQGARAVAALDKSAENLASHYGHLWLTRRAPEPIPEYPVLTNETFVDHVTQNEPFLVRGAASHWPAVSSWTPRSLAERFGSSTVEYMRGADRYTEPEPRRRTTLKTFGKWLERKPLSNEYYLTATNFAFESLSKLREDVLGFDSVPSLDTSGNSTMRLWMGPQGTITPLHHDTMPVLFVQISGRKRFLLASPFLLAWINIKRGVFAAVDPIAPDLFRNPRASELRYWCVDVEPGDVLLIPTGWWHWVYAYTQSISINFAHFATDGHRFVWRADEAEGQTETSNPSLTTRRDRATTVEAQDAQHLLFAPHITKLKARDRLVSNYLDARVARRTRFRALFNIYADLWTMLGWKRAVPESSSTTADYLRDSYARNTPAIIRGLVARDFMSQSHDDFVAVSNSAVALDDTNWRRQEATALLSVVEGSADVSLVPPFFEYGASCESNHKRTHDEGCVFCNRFARARLDSRDALLVPKGWWTRWSLDGATKALHSVRLVPKDECATRSSA